MPDNSKAKNNNVKGYSSKKETPNIIVNVNQAQSQNQVQSGANFPPKSKLTALLLCIFLGYFGIHRFYVGKSGTGILYLFSCGLFGIGWIIDIILIATGAFRDSMGRPLV